jgi:hypothetical protein
MRAGGRRYTRDEGRELSSRAIRNGDTSYIPKEVYAEIEARRRMESAQNALDAANRQNTRIPLTIDRGSLIAGEGRNFNWTGEQKDFSWHRKGKDFQNLLNLMRR